MTETYTTAVFSTLIRHQVPRAKGDPDPPTKGASLFWYVGSDGQVLVLTTQP